MSSENNTTTNNNNNTLPTVPTTNNNTVNTINTLPTIPTTNNNTVNTVPDNKQENVIYAQYIEKDYAWEHEQEMILKKWADKALCFKIMHERAYKRYWCLNAWFNIPIIIISTITGTGNFASGNFLSGSEYFIFALGALNLFGGVLATVSTYMGVAQKVESHRFASISWDKFSRRIQIELAKSRKDRLKARDFIRQSTEEYDRLIEMSPMLPNDIIRWFISLVENNDPEPLNDCGSCFYEYFCFACGCNMCFCCCCEESPNSNKPKLYSLTSSWKDIEIPEIAGRIKETEIAGYTKDPISYINNQNSVNINNPKLQPSKSRFIAIQNTSQPIKQNSVIIDMTKNSKMIELQKMSLKDINDNSDSE